MNQQMNWRRSDRWPNETDQCQSCGERLCTIVERHIRMPTSQILGSCARCLKYRTSQRDNWPTMTSKRSAHFPTTAWSVIRQAKDRDNAEYLTAMNRFMADYWRPVFYFVRARGYSFDRAQDVTQDFFIRLLEKDWIAKADRERGRFRTFLLTILTRFLSDQSVPRAPKQKTFDQQLVTISALIGDDERSFEPSDEMTADAVFMKRWAQALIANVLRQVSRWCDDRGRPDWFEIFSRHNFPPPGTSTMKKTALAARFSLSRDQVRYAADQVNEQFVLLLRQEVADQVGTDADIDAEIRELESLLD